MPTWYSTFTHTRQCDTHTPRIGGLHLKPLFVHTIHKNDTETDALRASPPRPSARWGTQQTLMVNDQKEKWMLNGCVVMNPEES